MNNTNFIKKFERGEMHLDLPYANCIYELPLLSFSDLKGGINLSLVFNQALQSQGNLFGINAGYKLNLEKRLLFGNNTIQYMEANGKISALHLSGAVGNDRYTFLDDSGRIIRPIENGYELEYSDFSREEYDTDGKIIATYDKYGDKVLQYYYENGKLTSVGFRITKDENDNEVAGKTISFVYGDQLTSIVFNDDTNATINVSYANNQVIVTHYSRVKYTLFAMNQTANSATYDRTFTVTLSDADDQTNTPVYRTNCIIDATDNRSMTVSDIAFEQTEDAVVEHEVNKTVYTFSEECPSPQTLCDYVEITDNQGVRTRVQFDGDKAMYAYEIGATDVEFYDYDGNANTNEDQRYPGQVTIYHFIGDPEYAPAMSYTQNYNDGARFSKDYSSTLNTWTINNTDNFGNGDGYCIISGWVYPTTTDTSGFNEITINVQSNSSVTYPVTMPEGKWSYFAFRHPVNSGITVLTVGSPNVCMVRDFKATYHDTSASQNSEPFSEAILQNEDGSVILLHEADFSDNGFNTGTNTVSFADVLRYILHPEKHELHYENFYDGEYRKEVCLTTAPIVFTHIVDDDPVECQLDQYYLGMRSYKGEHVVTTLYKRNVNGCSLTVETFAGTTPISTCFYDENMDIVKTEKENITTEYTRSKGLVTSIKQNNVLRQEMSYDHEQGVTIITDVPEGQTTAERLITTYCYNTAWGFLQSVTLPDGNVIQYTYAGDGGALLTQKFGSADTDPKHTFDYESGRLSSMAAGNNLQYAFTYDSKGELASVKKNGSVIEQHTHAPTSTTSYYPNSTSPLYSISRTYDKYGRLVSFDNGALECSYSVATPYHPNLPTITVADNAASRLAETVDNVVHETAKYEYSAKGLLVKKTVTDQNDVEKSTDYFEYDKANRMYASSYACNALSKTVVSEITYVKTENDPSADGKISKYVQKINGAEKAKTETLYDTQNRWEEKLLTMNGHSFSKWIDYEGSRVFRLEDAFASDLRRFEYYYDPLGRIKTEKYTASGSSSSITYAYDQFGRLIRENNPYLDKSVTYEYNESGNMTSAKTYNYTTAETLSGTPTTQTFTYDATHKDRLTSFGNKAITYNANGEMASFDGWTYSWSKGKLTNKSKGTRATGRYSYSFSYNALGQRVAIGYSYLTNLSSQIPVQIGEVISYSKKYYYDNAGRLMFETKASTLYGGGSDYYEIAYLYDQSSMVGMELTKNNQSTLYYFQRNLLGDVVAIYDTNGTLKVRYIYDAWGNCTIASGSDMQLAIDNPIRYRGYYYDQDTGLYYLNARYYNPELRRFISPDDTAYLDPETVDGLNLYVYCCNDPVNYADPSGCAPKWLRDALDIGLYVASATIALATAIAVASVATTATGIAAGIAMFGALNNLTNAIYYNYISNSKSSLTSSSYRKGYVNRWDRLDYTKRQTGQSTFNTIAWMYYSEYGLHMYGWYISGWAYEKNVPLFSWLAERTKSAEITEGEWDERWYVNIGIIILGLLGL